MRTIYKYPLEVSDKQHIYMPANAEILSVQVQKSTICLWALVDSDAPNEFRYFELFGTGHTVPCDMGVERKFIGTIQLLGDNVVFHLFERIN